MRLRPPDLENLEPATDEQLGRGHLSTSGIGTMLACEQKWNWQYEHRFAPAVKKVSLSAGAAFAEALEHGDPQHAWGKVMGEHARASEAFAGNPWVKVPPENEAEVVAQIAREAARAYLKHYGGHQVREHAMRCRIRNPRTGHPSLTFDLVCRVDALDLNSRTLIEDKLVGQIPRKAGEMDRRLRLDRQVSIETYTIWRTTGVEIADVRYRMTLKPGIEQRKGRATRDGGRTGVETHEQYLDRIAQEYATRPDHYLAEFPCTRTPEDFLRLEAELWRWAEQLRSARADGVWPRNSSACMEYGGCTYLPLCAREPGAEHQYIERPHHEPAQQQLSTPDKEALAA